MADLTPARSRLESQSNQAPDSLLQGYAFFRGEIVPMPEAKVSIATHALHYGTGVFEGIRAYYHEGEDQLYCLLLKEHYERLLDSCRIIRINLGYSLDDLCRITLELLRANNFRTDIYIRPIAYKASLGIGLKLTGLEDALAIYAFPIGEYLDTSKGLHVMVATWTRPEDNTMPVRAKLCGAYVNSCLASDDAKLNGFDEAIQLTPDGHVSEGSSCNLFMVRNGKVITTPVTDAILEGITRRAVLQIARDLGFDTEERRIDRTELYVADELFFVGTGVQVAPITRVDHRPVGDGTAGKITLQIQDSYFKAVRGQDPKYKQWLTPVY